MPKNASDPIPVDQFVELTAHDATSVTFQNIGEAVVVIAATSNPSAPASDTRGIRYAPGQGEVSRPIAQLFPGVTGAVRLWARAVSLPSRVYTSHA